MVGRDIFDTAHVGLATTASKLTFWVSILVIYEANTLLLIFFYLFVGPCLLGDEEEEELTDHLEGESLIDRVKLYSTYYAEVIFDDEFLNFYDSVIKAEQGLTPTLIDRFSEVEFSMWDMQEFLETVEDDDPQQLDFRRYNSFLLYNWKCRSFFKPVSRRNFINSIIVSNFYEEITDISRLKTGHLIENLDETFKVVATKRTSKGEGWFNWVRTMGTRYIETKVQGITEMERQAKIYNVLQAIIKKGFHSNDFSEYLLYHKFDFTDAWNASYKFSYRIVNSNLSESDKIRVFMKWYDLLNVSFYFDDDALLFEFSDPRTLCGYHRDFYFFNVYGSGIVTKKICSAARSITTYSLHTRASYINLVYLRLPWHEPKYTFRKNCEY